MDLCVRLFVQPSNQNKAKRDRIRIIFYFPQFLAEFFRNELQGLPAGVRVMGVAVAIEMSTVSLCSNH